MGIYKYEVINPVTDTKKPFLDKKDILYVITKSLYRYYVEVAVFDKKSGNRNYYILLSKERFDKSCRLCNTDNYGRCKIKLRGELLDYVKREIKERGNVEVTYEETVENYDIFSIE